MYLRNIATINNLNLTRFYELTNVNVNKVKETLYCEMKYIQCKGNLRRDTSFKNIYAPYSFN